MRIDEYGMLVMQQNDDSNPDGFQGNRGDSCAETFRDFNLDIHLGVYFPSHISKAFIQVSTPLGYLRHPLTKWRENEFSGDQCLPMYLALRASGLTDLANSVVAHLERNNWRTGNGDKIHQPFVAAIKRGQGQPSFYNDLSLIGQILIMTKIPFRWNDEKRWFERSSGSSADWVNYYHSLIQCEQLGHTWASRKAKSMTDPRLLYSKIQDYYRIEPNAYVVDKYKRSIEKTWNITL